MATRFANITLGLQLCGLGILHPHAHYKGLKLQSINLASARRDPHRFYTDK